MHKENIRLLKLILKSRSMLLMRYIGDRQEPVHNNELLELIARQNGLDPQFDNVPHYDTSALLELTRKSFKDNVNRKISSNITFDNSDEGNDWNIVSRKTFRKVGRNILMYNQLNYDRIRMPISDQYSRKMKSDNLHPKIHIPSSDDFIDTILPKAYSEFSKSGIVVDLV